MADASDLKSDFRKEVPVRVRSRAPLAKANSSDVIDLQQFGETLLDQSAGFGCRSESDLVRNAISRFADSC